MSCGLEKDWRGLANKFAAETGLYFASYMTEAEDFKVVADNIAFLLTQDASSFGSDIEFAQRGIRDVAKKLDFTLIYLLGHLPSDYPHRAILESLKS